MKQNRNTGNAIGDRLRRLRGDRSLEGTAAEIGICVKSLLAYETGESIPRDELKPRIAKHYGQPIDTIFSTK